MHGPWGSTVTGRGGSTRRSGRRPDSALLVLCSWAAADAAAASPAGMNGVDLTTVYYHCMDDRTNGPAGLVNAGETTRGHCLSRRCAISGWASVQRAGAAPSSHLPYCCVL